MKQWLLILNLFDDRQLQEMRKHVTNDNISPFFLVFVNIVDLDDIVNYVIQWLGFGIIISLETNIKYRLTGF